MILLQPSVGIRYSYACLYGRAILVQDLRQRERKIRMPKIKIDNALYEKVRSIAEKQAILPQRVCDASSGKGISRLEESGSKEELVKSLKGLGISRKRDDDIHTQSVRPRPCTSSFFISCGDHRLLAFVSTYCFAYFKKISNQDKIKYHKDKIVGYILETYLYRDRIGRTLLSQINILKHNLYYLRYMVAPLLVILIP